MPRRRPWARKRPPPSAAALAGPLGPFVAVAGDWELSAREACALLGGVSPRVWSAIKAGTWARRARPPPDVLERQRALAAVARAARDALGPELARAWARLPRTGPPFGGRTPLEHLAAGHIPAMLEVERLAATGGGARLWGPPGVPGA